MKKILLLFSMLFIANNVLSQSAWVQEKGKNYSQISYSLIGNYHTIFADPEYDTEREISDATIQLYSEYGINNSLTIFANLPIKYIQAGELANPTLVNIPTTSKKNITSLGNIEIGIKKLFYNKNYILSGQLQVEANTGTYDSESGIKTGNDSWGITPLLLAAKGYNTWYLQGFIGGTYRSNNYSSYFKVGGEIGKKIAQRIWIIGYVDVLKSFKNGTIEHPTANNLTALYLNDSEYGVLGLKAIGEFSDNFGITGGFSGGAFIGNNVPKKPSFTVGLYHKF